MDVGAQRCADRTRRGSVVRTAAAQAWEHVFGRRSRLKVPLPRVPADDVGAAVQLAREQDRLHEVRATVAGLTSSYQLLRGPQEIPQARRARLERLHGLELSRLGRLLDDDPGATPDAVDLDDVVEPFVQSMRTRGHRVRWEASGRQVLGRPDDVALIVHVLLQNAARHGAGEIAVEVVDRDDLALDVVVYDHGTGVSPELVGTLFERGARRPESPGTGLGLGIARRTARALDGDLALARPPARDRGATFVLTLPTPSGCSCLAMTS